MNSRKNFNFIEINTFAFVTRLCAKYGKQLTLLTVPDEVWKDIRSRGFDMVWLMGVWQRSPAAWKHALERFRQKGDYKKALPDCRDEDVTGSPYSIYGYTLDPYLGKPGDLPALRRKLNALGLKLIVDFVPNHLAVDHPWTLTHPEWFVGSCPQTWKKHPDWFFKTARGVMLAHGKDPYFPPWIDTAQVNFSSAGMREAMIGELTSIAEAADGVRCDMAMLGLNAVFKRVWQECPGKDAGPKTEFWKDAISAVKMTHPEFLFMAEVYWDLEKPLQDLGFDYTYDKQLYDKLMHSPVHDIRDHLRRPPGYLERSVHFTENHDEARAVVAFGRERSLASAAVMATVPGIRLFHDGQMRGLTVHVPIQLRRSPDEKSDPEAEDFYRKLLHFASDPVLTEGDWQLLDVEPGDGQNIEPANLLAWQWEMGNKKRLVVINYGPFDYSGKIHLTQTVPSAATGEEVFRDELTGQNVPSVEKEKEVSNLAVNLPAWGVELLRGRE